MARVSKVFDKVLDKRGSPEKEFGNRPPMEDASDIIDKLAKKLKSTDYYTRHYAALDLRDMARKGIDIEPARHILIEMRDDDAAPNCNAAAKEALDAADTVSNERYDVGKQGKEAMDEGPYHVVFVNGKGIDISHVLRCGGNTVKRKAIRKIEEIAKKGIAGQNISNRIDAAAQLKKIAEDQTLLDGLDMDAKSNLRKALENVSEDDDATVKTLAELGLKALDGKI